MAAVITAPHYTPAPRPIERPRHLRPAPDRTSGRTGPRARPSAAILRRRRIVVGLLAFVLAVGAGVAAVRVVRGVEQAGAPTPAMSTTGGAGEPLVSGSTYVVRAGDTLWAIAERLDQGGDVRSVVDALVERTGGAELRPGQVIDLDGLG